MLQGSLRLCCDSIVGIVDPLRPDVKDAVRVAQNAGPRRVRRRSNKSNINQYNTITYLWILEANF
jgi:hypothetical protein